MSDQTGSMGQLAARSVKPPDEINEHILAELRADGRISMSALADRVGVSRATVYSRVAALQDAGIITGYSAMVDPRRVGLAVCSLVFVSVHPQTWASFRSQIVAMSEIEYCAVTSGEHDAMLLVRTADVADIHAFVTGVISSMPEVKAVETVLVMDEVIRRPYLLPCDAASGSQPESVGMTRFIPTPASRHGVKPVR